MAARPNPLFTRSEKGRVRKKIRHKIKSAARSGLARMFGIPLSSGLGGRSSSRPSSRRAAHRHSPASGPNEATPVRGDVISALRNLGYTKAQAEHMTPSARAGESLDALFRRAVQKNPSELIIFGNPEQVYGKAQLRKANPLRVKNLVPLAVLEGLRFGVGEKIAGEVLTRRRRGRRNAEHQHNEHCGHTFCFHGAFRDKADAVAQEKSHPGSFVRNLRFGPGDYRWAVLTKRVGNTKRNPGSLDRAEDLFQRFHHRSESGTFETQRSAKLRKDFTILGPLVAIGINAEKYDHARGRGGKSWEDYKVEHWDRLPHLGFLAGPQVSHVKRILEDPEQYVKDCPQLASSPNGRQLYAITPDGVDVDLRQFDTDRTKDFVDLGEATFIVYVAKKPDEAVEWVHELGEEGGTRPRLMFDRLKREIFFVGGSYRVDGPGILN